MSGGDLESLVLVGGEYVVLKVRGERKPVTINGLSVLLRNHLRISPVAAPLAVDIHPLKVHQVRRHFFESGATDGNVIPLKDSLRNFVGKFTPGERFSSRRQSDRQKGGLRRNLYARGNMLQRGTNVPL
ncbi:MAG: hypothetical protein WKF30_08940 [Pyrinomonadaceae bacterium]